MPELELGQSAHERPELVILLRRQRRLSVLDALVLRQARVELGRYEREEEVEQVDAEAVGNYVPALRQHDAEEEEQEEHAGADPAVGCIWCGLVEVGLVYLQVSAERGRLLVSEYSL